MKLIGILVSWLFINQNLLYLCLNLKTFGKFIISIFFFSVSEVFVSSKGNDSINCGSLKKPCNSLVKAYNLVQLYSYDAIFVTSDSEDLGPENEQFFLNNSVIFQGNNINNYTKLKVDKLKLKNSGSSDLFVLKADSTISFDGFVFEILEGFSEDQTSSVFSVTKGSLFLISCHFKRENPHLLSNLHSSVIDITGGTCTIDGCKFEGLVLDNSKIEKKRNGAAINAILKTEEDFLVISSSSFSECKSVHGNGGAIYVEVGGKSNLAIGGIKEEQKCVFISNKAGNDKDEFKGGAIYLNITNSYLYRKGSLLLQNIQFGNNDRISGLNEASKGSDMFIETLNLNNTIFSSSVFPFVNNYSEDKNVKESLQVIQREDNKHIIKSLYNILHKNEGDEFYVKKNGSNNNNNNKCPNSDPCGSLLVALSSINNNNNSNSNSNNNNKIIVLSEDLNAETSYLIINNSIEIIPDEVFANHVKLIINKFNNERMPLFNMGLFKKSLIIHNFIFKISDGDNTPNDAIIRVPSGSVELYLCFFERTVSHPLNKLSSSAIVINGGSASIIGCRFDGLVLEHDDKDNTTGSGAAIWGKFIRAEESLTISGSTFKGLETSEGNGGAIYVEVEGAGKVTIGGENAEQDNCTFESCQAGNEKFLTKGGAIYMKISSKLSEENGLVLLQNIQFGGADKKSGLNEAANGKNLFVEAYDLSKEIINTKRFPIMNDFLDDDDECLRGSIEGAKTGSDCSDIKSLSKMLSSIKYIFITGGVVSSLGKGLTSGTLGALLECHGYKVKVQKFDPYLNVDPGTMSPYQHGEVYVLDDGSETDLDLGHYERFTNSKLSKENSVSAGQVYASVIEKERRGDYLGQTVQIIPHVTDEIKEKFQRGAKDCDILITEIGGTVGDIEGLPFLEALRQMAMEVGRDNILYIHIALIPYLRAAQELKTKPCQQSVAKLREIGIQPDILICRTEKTMTVEMKAKISMFCNVPLNCVIEEQDVKHSIYELPSVLHDEHLDKIVLDRLSLPCGHCDISKWNRIVEKIKSPKSVVKVGLVGKYTDLKDAYKSICEALAHAGLANDCKVNVIPIDSEDLEKEGIDQLKSLDGILVPGGFGIRGTNGMILAAKYARENNIPYFGICLGMHIASIEFAKDVAGIEGATSEEFDKNVKNKVVFLMEQQKNITKKGGTMRLGLYDCVLQEGTISKKAYGKEKIAERHRHRFEFNPEFEERMVEKGLKVAGRNPQTDLVEIIEIPTHRWFVAVQFHPEFLSKPMKPHPLFSSFIKSVKENMEEKK